ncbi:MAG: hypothetical protein ABIP20_20185 [Chthoniobacteraceae bacterium]
MQEAAQDGEAVTRARAEKAQAQAATDAQNGDMFGDAVPSTKGGSIEMQRELEARRIRDETRRK